MSADVTFLEHTQFSSEHIPQGKDDDLLIYTVTHSLDPPFSIPVKPAITQTYTRCYRSSAPATEPTFAPVPEPPNS